MSLIDAWGWEQMCPETRPKPKRKESESMSKKKAIAVKVVYEFELDQPIETELENPTKEFKDMTDKIFEGVHNLTDELGHKFTRCIAGFIYEDENQIGENYDILGVDN